MLSDKIEKRIKELAVAHQLAVTGPGSCIESKKTGLTILANELFAEIKRLREALVTTECGCGEKMSGFRKCLRCYELESSIERFGE